MSVNIHLSTENIPSNIPLTYYQKEYFDSQDYSQFIAFSDDSFLIAFDIKDQSAISIPKSPFGSVLKQKKSPDNELLFFEKVTQELTQRSVKNIIIHHPASIYETCVPAFFLEKFGFRELYLDLNHHILLDQNWDSSIHKMQERKLQSLRHDGFEFQRMDHNSFKTAHDFLTVCRKAQDLTLNISWEHLQKLITHLPNQYECFGVFRNGKISSLCICVNVTNDIAYYYLPATSPLFRNQSPMVLLIARMVDYYRKKGFKYLDMGISSIQGKPQESLKIFKERMGGIASTKPTFELAL